MKNYRLLGSRSSVRYAVRSCWQTGKGYFRIIREARDGEAVAFVAWRKMGMVMDVATFLIMEGDLSEDEQKELIRCAATEYAAFQIVKDVHTSDVDPL